MNKLVRFSVFLALCIFPVALNAQFEVSFDAATGTLSIPRSIVDGDPDNSIYSFDVVDDGFGNYTVANAAWLGTATEATGLENEVIFYPNTGVLYMPKVIISGDATSTFYSVEMIADENLFFSVTAVQDLGNGAVYYIRPNEFGASDSNDGLSAVYKGGESGPWATLDPIEGRNFTNDTIVLGEGVYEVGEITLAFDGMALKGLVNETAVIDGGDTTNVWDLLGSITDVSTCESELPNLLSQFTSEQQVLFGSQNNIHISANDVTVENLEIRNSLHYNVLITGDRATLINNTIHNSQEDNVKITDVVGGFVFGNDIYDTLNEQIDVIFGQDITISTNELHGTRDIPCGRTGHAVFAKGGASNIVFENNEIYDILSAPNNGALGLGGGGGGEGVQFQEKDENGDYFPIGSNIVARNNHIHDVNQAGLAFLGCGNCIAEGNTIENAIVGVIYRHGVIDETDIDPENGEVIELASFNATLNDNIFTNIDFIALYETSSMEGISADNNSYTMSSGFSGSVVETTGDIKDDLGDPSLTMELDFEEYRAKYSIEANSTVTTTP